MVKHLENHIALENGLLLQHTEDFEARFKNIEQRFHFDHEVTIIARTISHSPTEDPIEIADKIIKEGLNILDVSIQSHKMCDSESSWLGSNVARRPVLKSAYVHARKMFDRERQRCKRVFWKKEQDRLLNECENDPNKFWKSIGKIGVKQEKSPKNFLKQLMNMAI